MEQSQMNLRKMFLENEEKEKKLEAERKEEDMIRNILITQEEIKKKEAESQKNPTINQIDPEKTMMKENDEINKEDDE